MYIYIYIYIYKKKIYNICSFLLFHVHLFIYMVTTILPRLLCLEAITFASGELTSRIVFEGVHDVGHKAYAVAQVVCVSLTLAASRLLRWLRDTSTRGVATTTAQYARAHGRSCNERSERNVLHY